MKKNQEFGKVQTTEPTTEDDNFTGTVFDIGLGDDPLTLLDNAKAVTRFLIDVTPAMQMDEGQLTKAGFFGLYLILTGVENTINAASDCLIDQ